MRWIDTRGRVVCAGLFLWTGVASAQRISGVVRDSAARQPLAGAVVTVLDGAGRSLAQALTDKAGRYVISGGNATASLEVKRIGFWPRRLVLGDSARFLSAVVDISLAPIPYVMESMRVTAVGCPTERTTGEAMGWWEQARAGLLATIVARTASPAAVRLIVSNAAITPRTGKPLSQIVTIDSGVAAQPFGAELTPAQLASTGYLEFRNRQHSFFGPDPSVLLDESFRDTHCFKLAGFSVFHLGEIGIDFQPVRGREGMADIEGTLWLSRAPLALRSLEFRYAGVPRPMRDADAGGTLVFKTADNGVVVIERWTLRMAETAGGASLTALGRKTGVVLGATWPDGSTIRNAFPRVVATVQDKERLDPVERVRVEFTTSPYQGLTGTDGKITFEDVFPGPYVATVFDSAYAAFGLVRSMGKAIEVKEDRDQTFTFQLESVIGRARALCQDVFTVGNGALALRVLDTTGAPAVGPFTVGVVHNPVDRTMKEQYFNWPSHTIIMCGFGLGTVNIAASDTLGRVLGKGALTIRLPARLDTLTIVLRRR